MTKISAAFDGNDWESLRLLAHSLKGSAANIGANALQEAAQELEMASQEEAIKPPASLLFENVEAALNQVLESLQSLVVTPKIEPLYGKARRLDPAQLISILEQLANALDLAEPEKIKKHMEFVKEHLDSAIFQDLEDLVNDYDYDEALRTLKRIVENIGRQTD